MTQTDELVDALCAIDSATLERVADETGIGASTLWRYRRHRVIPQRRRKILARALGLRPTTGGHR